MAELSPSPRLAVLQWFGWLVGVRRLARESRRGVRQVQLRNVWYDQLSNIRLYAARCCGGHGEKEVDKEKKERANAARARPSVYIFSSNEFLDSHESDDSDTSPRTAALQPAAVPLDLRLKA